jgi:nicotinamide mononucleotide transporter
MLKIFIDFFSNTPVVDIIAVLSGIIYVILAARNHILCWIFGIIGSSLTMYSVFFNYNLYLETFLNGFYVLAAIWGWINWSKQKNAVKQIKSYSLIQHLPIIGIAMCIVVITGYFFDNYTNSSAPYLDAFTTVFALMTTFMIGMRILENWLYWMIIDSASIYLYSSRGAYFYVILFSVYIIVSISGYLQWRKEYRAYRKLTL